MRLEHEERGKAFFDMVASEGSWSFTNVNAALIDIHRKCGKTQDLLVLEYSHEERPSFWTGGSRTM